MATGIAILLVLAYVAWHYTTYNGFVNARTGVEQSWSNVEVELKRRLDLIDNLVAVVKGYAAHEASTLEATVKARTPISMTGGALQATQSIPVLKDVIGKIFGLAEAYPDLKAAPQFLSLQEELVTTENRIAERRHAYNQTVSRYQNLKQAFPSSIVGSLHDFPNKEFFDAPDNIINEVTTVKFS